MADRESMPGSEDRLYATARFAEQVAVLASQRESLVRRSHEIASGWYDFQDLRFTRNRLWNALEVACRHAHVPPVRQVPADQAVYSFRSTATGVSRLVRHAQISGGSALNNGSETALTCTQQRLEGVVRLSVSGELDLATAPTFRAHLDMATHGADNVIVDLTGLLYLDSSGINALLDAHHALAPSRRQIVLVGPSPNV